MFRLKGITVYHKADVGPARRDAEDFIGDDFDSHADIYRAIEQVFDGEVQTYTLDILELVQLQGGADAIEIDFDE